MMKHVKVTVLEALLTVALGALLLAVLGPMIYQFGMYSDTPFSSRQVKVVERVTTARRSITDWIYGPHVIYTFKDGTTQEVTPVLVIQDFAKDDKVAVYTRPNGKYISDVALMFPQNDSADTAKTKSEIPDKS
jgi:hypothetical protein